MKNLKKISLIGISFFIGIFGIVAIFAATSPALNSAGTFAILASTFTNSSSTTVIGDIGYTTPPATPATLSGTIHMADSLYTQAGLDQASTLANLNSQTCTFNFAPGAIDLATDTTHGPIGVYSSGVYCITGAASIGTAGIVLNGTGTYIFRITGALTSVDNSNITLSGAASNCNVFWTPSAATTLGANTNFKGIIISPAGITMGANTNLLGRALAYGGTVTTDANIITAPICSSPANLKIIKNVVGGGPNKALDFNIYVKYSSGTNVIGSPATGTGSPGRNYSLSAGNYIVSEDNNSSYTKSFSGDCDASGNITLSVGSNKTCTITNTYIIPASSSGGGGGIYKDVCPEGDYSYSYYDNICGTAPKSNTGTISSTGTIIKTTSFTGTVTNTGNTTKENTGTIIEEIVLPIPEESLPIEIEVPPYLKIVEVNKRKTRSPSFPDTGFGPKEIR